MFPPYRLANRDWLALLERSCADGALGLPSFPAEELQLKWVGRANADTIREVAPFYALAQKYLQAPLLDFGVGWGRICRFFLNDLPADAIYGADTNAAILAECRRLRVPGTHFLIEPRGRLPVLDAMFGLVTAYSVFTHLSPAAADHWIREITRTIAPGRSIIATVMTSRFFELCAQGKDEGTLPWQKKLGAIFASPREEQARYQRGEFVYAGTDENYGWAAVPPRYIERHWNMNIIEFHDDLGFGQGACVMMPR